MFSIGLMLLDLDSNLWGPVDLANLFLDEPIAIVDQHKFQAWAQHEYQHYVEYLAKYSSLEPFFIQAVDPATKARREIRYATFSGDFSTLVDTKNEAAVFYVTSEGYLLSGEDFVGPSSICTDCKVALLKGNLPSGPPIWNRWLSDAFNIAFQNSTFCFGINDQLFVVFGDGVSDDCQEVTFIAEPAPVSTTSTSTDEGTGTTTTASLSTSSRMSGKAVGSSSSSSVTTPGISSSQQSSTSSPSVTASSSTHSQSSTTNPPASSPTSSRQTTTSGVSSPAFQSSSSSYVTPSVLSSSTTFETSTQPSSAPSSAFTSSSSTVPTLKSTSSSSSSSSITSSSAVTYSSSSQLSSTSSVSSSLATSSTSTPNDSSSPSTSSTSTSSLRSSSSSSSSSVSPSTSLFSSSTSISSSTSTSTSMSQYSTTTTTSTSSPSPTPNILSGKRGLAYSNVNHTYYYPPPTQVSWAYNYYYAPNSSSSRGIFPRTSSYPLRFIPLLFNDDPSLAAQWPGAVSYAIANYGTDAIFSFNEPDLCVGGSACMSVPRAIAAYKLSMQPFANQTRLVAPAITNAGSGFAWLRDFLGNASLPQNNLTVDIINIHWYASPYNMQYFIDYMTQASVIAAGRPIWITEYGMDQTYNEADTQIFMRNTTYWCDQQSFIERYAWFGNYPNNLLNSAGTALGPRGVIWNSYVGSNYVYFPARVAGRGEEARKRFVPDAEEMEEAEEKGMDGDETEWNRDGFVEKMWWKADGHMDGK